MFAIPSELFLDRGRPDGNDHEGILPVGNASGQRLFSGSLSHLCVMASLFGTHHNLASQPRTLAIKSTMAILSPQLTRTNGSHQRFSSFVPAYKGDRLW